MTIDLPPTRTEFHATYDRATVRDWSGAVNSWWNNAGNWIPNGVPQLGDHVQQYVGTSMFNMGTLTLDRLYTGGASLGTVTHQLEGALSVNTFAIGINGTAGEYRFGGTNTRLTTGLTYVGANGVGSINVNSGTWAASQFLSIGDAPTARGRVFQAGGRVSTPELNVGYYGRGTYEIHGGSLLVGSFFSVGHIVNAAGTVEMAGGSILSPIGVVGLTGSGTLIQSAGSIQALQWFDLGEDAEASGFYHLSGGTLTTPEFAVGFLGKGEFLQSGGVVNVGPIYVGDFGSVELTGGVLDTDVLNIDPGGRFNLTRHEAKVADTSNVRDYILGGNLHADGAVGYSASEVKATLLGDANLDRTVNIADSGILGAHFGQPGEWYHGDFNYDGTVDIADFGLMAANYGQSYGRAANVPEPVALVAALPLMWRRRG